MTSDRIERYRKARAERIAADDAQRFAEDAENAAYHAMTSEEQDEWRRELKAMASKEGTR
jgi:transcription elongation GreA/GreB family factor